jgi:GAF domain-containing protein/FixJ family two-component response regulator
MSGECILIIDDSREIVKHLTKHVLPTFDFKTLYAYDGQTGLAYIRNKNPDLVMLDFNLPEMTGIDVLQQMAKEAITTPVILMTGYGSELSAIEAFRLGAKDYLIKPFTVDEVIDTIERALVEVRLLHDKTQLAEQLRRIKVEMSRQTHEMNTLFNIGKAITSLLSVDDVLKRVMEAATYLTNSEEGHIWLVNESATKLQAYDKNGLNNGPVEWVKIDPDTYWGQVILTGQPVRIAQLSNEGLQVKPDYTAHSLLFIPLKLRGLTLGVLGVSNRVTYKAFSKRDEFLLSFLADYAAIALENARVFQAADRALASRVKELNTLIGITRTITSTLDLDEVVRLTIKTVHASWDIEVASLWWLDKNKSALRVLANVGTPTDVLNLVEVPLGEGFVGHVAKTGKWVYTNDVSTHPLHYRDVDSRTGFKTYSLLCVPLMFGGLMVGAMQLLNKQDGDFDDSDVERALSIAAAVAIAVTNAMRFVEIESRRTPLEDGAA